MKRFNKKGVGMGGMVAAFLVIGFIAIGLLGYLVYTTQQQAVAPSAATKEVVEAITGGDIASLKINAYDREQENRATRTTTPVYCREKGADGILIADAKTLSTSDRTTVQTVTGKTIECIAFNNQYYGDWNEIKMDTEKEDLDLDVHMVANTSQIAVYSSTGQDVGNGYTNYTVNISVEAGGSGEFSKVLFKVNISNRQYNLGGFYIDFDNSTIDIEDVTLKPGDTGTTPKEGTDSMLNRVTKSKRDAIIDLGDPIILNEWDTATFGSMVFTSSGSACPVGSGLLTDSFQIYAFDKAYSRSTQSETITGYIAETDTELSPSDVGAVDIVSEWQHCCSGSTCTT